MLGAGGRYTATWKSHISHFCISIHHHHSPGDKARELFKPSKDVQSPVVSIEKLGKFWVLLMGNIIVGIDLGKTFQVF